MNRYALAAFFVLVSVWISGCGSSNKQPEVATVKGTVNLDGKPMADGEIRFSVAGFPPKSHTISNGAYSGEATVGKNIVEVFKYKEVEPKGEVLSSDPKKAKVNILPEKYSGQKSTLSAEVTSGGANDFKFDVTAN